MGLFDGRLSTALGVLSFKAILWQFKGKKIISRTSAHLLATKIVAFASGGELKLVFLHLLAGALSLCIANVADTPQVLLGDLVDLNKIGLEL